MTAAQQRHEPDLFLAALVASGLSPSTYAVEEKTNPRRYGTTDETTISTMGMFY